MVKNSLNIQGVFFGQELLYFVTIGQNMIFSALESPVFRVFWRVLEGLVVRFRGGSAS